MVEFMASLAYESMFCKFKERVNRMLIEIPFQDMKGLAFEGNCLGFVSMS